MSTHILSKGIRRFEKRGYASLLRLRRTGDDEGSTLVEMAIVCSVLMAMLFGIFEISMALYSYHFVSAAAREATRFAMVRGANCKTNVNTAYCSPYSGNATDGATGLDISNYVKNLGYPFASQLTTTSTWLTAGTDSNGYAAWTPCTWLGCHVPGNQVQVQVSYAFPLTIPFWRGVTLNLSSRSSMVISQ